MSEMTDRVAAAIKAAHPKEGMMALHDEVALHIARAAIEAMREPTDRMISEGESAASFGIGKPSDDEAIPRVWRYMINAALASPSIEPQKGELDGGRD